MRVNPNQQASNEVAGSLERIVDSILAAIPPGAYVIPDEPPKSGLEDRLQIGSTPIQFESAVEKPTAKDNQRRSSPQEIKRWGRLRLEDNEFELTRLVNIVADFNGRRLQDPSMRIEDIELDMEGDYGIPPRTLRAWRKRYKTLSGD